MNRLLLTPLFCACIGAYTPAHAENSISLQQAILTKKVLVSARGVGGYSGKCLNLNMVNLTCEKLNIHVDPALIFKPTDTNYQNLVVVGDENITVEPDKETNLTLQTFCGKSYAHCPAAGLTFNLWKQGDSIMIKTVRFIKDNNYYNDLGQSAIWTLTNGRCINTIYNPDKPDDSKKFINFEAGLRRMQIPEYFSFYQIDTSLNAAACVSENGKQYVDLVYKDGVARNVYIIVLDDKGELYNKTDIKENIRDGVHTVTINFDETKDKLGLYAVLLRDDYNNILGRKLVRVGEDWCY